MARADLSWINFTAWVRPALVPRGSRSVYKTLQGFTDLQPRLNGMQDNFRAAIGLMAQSLPHDVVQHASRRARPTSLLIGLPTMRPKRMPAPADNHNYFKHCP
jgi:hypothetical protein